MGAWVETSPKEETRNAARTSLPAWGRGLKLKSNLNALFGIEVAPRMGAWVETCISAGNNIGNCCRSPHGGVG